MNPKLVLPMPLMVTDPSSAPKHDMFVTSSSIDRSTPMNGMSMKLSTWHSGIAASITEKLKIPVSTLLRKIVSIGPMFPASVSYLYSGLVGIGGKGVPPSAHIFTTASLLPSQEALSNNSACKINGSMYNVADSVAEQPLRSVTVTVYVPLPRLSISCVN